MFDILRLKLLMVPILMLCMVQGAWSMAYRDAGIPLSGRTKDIGTRDMARVIRADDSLPGDCVANFQVLPDTENPLLFHFQDLSTGDYEDLYWNFGDGVTSEESNPEHTYQYSGYFQVCLTISSEDSLSGCYDVTCQTILAGDTSACKANFISVLDSNDITPYFYRFYDLSTGNINSWLWDFGDGTSSTEQNPAHQYDQGGTFEVCLTVMNNEFPNTCFDILCQGISTPGYYSLGGLVYAGGYPLNNPYPQGDTGIAYLYRVSNGHVVPSGTRLFSDLGYYWFLNVMEGNYIVKVELTPGSTHYYQYFTTYFENKVFWNQAESYIVNDTSFFAANIYLAPVGLFIPGPCKIQGTVVIQNQGIQTSLAHSEVVLSDEDNHPLTFTYSDLNGSFEFDNLPYGSYNVIPDVTGKSTIPYQVILTQNNPSNDTINLVVYEEGSFGIGELTQARFSVKKLYPNPVKETLCIGIESRKETGIRIDITDLPGRALVSRDFTLQAGDQVITIPVPELTPGIYLVSFRSSEGVLVASRKILK
jgi:hypothetical protein